MGKQLKNLTLGAILLLLPALVTLGSGWQWTGQFHPVSSYPFYLFTQTVTRPWGIITSIALAVLLYRHPKYSGRNVWVLILLIMVVVWGGQGIKSIMKLIVLNPDPMLLRLWNKNISRRIFFISRRS